MQSQVFLVASFTVSPAFFILLAVLAYPILYTIEISFSELDLGTFLPSQWVGWDNYELVLTDERFWHSLKVTGIYLAFAMPLQMAPMACSRMPKRRLRPSK